ncbi:MAG TPA: hypothetical protein DCQ83_07525, partial [Fibrobacteres bacterium]|nr:hypothetical protein [Fibrobacterota bacterium]
GISSTTVTPTVNNGGLPITYTSDPLPAGLSINSSTGVISGTPSTGSNTANYTVTATNSMGSTNASLNFTMLNPISTFTYPTHNVVLATTVAMTPDSPTVSGTDPFGPDTFSVSPSLPTGLSMSTSTGTISGTPTTAQASTKYTITARNGISAFNMVDSVFIAVPNAPTSLSYTLTAASFEEGQSITSMSPTVGGTSPVTPLTYSITSGALPSGLSLDTSTGIISGTPGVGASAGSPYAVTITATNPKGSTSGNLSIPVQSGEDYSQWAYSTDMVLNTAASTGAGVTTAQSNFPVLVRLTSQHARVFQQDIFNGTDIRFTNGSGRHLSYQIERWDSAGKKAEIWVRADNVAGNGTTTIRMYWCNYTNPASRSSGPAVFNTGYVGAWHLGDTTGIDPRPNAVAGAPTAKPSNNFSGAQFGGGAGTYVIPDGVIAKADTIRGGGTRAVPVATSDYLNLGDLPDSVQASNTAPYYQGKNTYTGYSNFSTGFTYSLWVKPGTAAGNYSYMLEMATTNGASNNMQFFRQTTATTYTYEHVNNTTSGGTKTTASGTMVLGTWQHMVVTVGTGSTPAVNIYKNGASIFTQSNETNAIANILRTNAWIGKSNYTGDYYFNGMFDEPEIHNVARSADWVKLTYKTQKSGVTPLFDLTYPQSSPVYTNAVPIAVDSPTIAGAALKFKIDSALPSGLVFDTVTGKISGTPTVVFPSRNYTVTAYGDSLWLTTTTLNITVNQNSGAPTNLAYNPSAYVFGVNTPSTTATPTVANGDSLLRVYSVSPALPAGLSLNTSTGVISGTPTTPQAAQNDTVTFTNSFGSTSTVITIRITPAPTNLAYSANPAVYIKGSAIANNVPTVTDTVTSWSIDTSVSKLLPSGISFNKTSGVFSGTPTAVTATTSYLVTASNLAGSDTETVTITVNPVAPTALNYVSTAFYQLGDSVNISPSFTGEAVTFSVNPSLPTGLNLNTSTGVISGSATTLSASTNYVVAMANATGSLMDTIGITVDPVDDYSLWPDSASFTLNTTTAGASVTSGQKNFPVLVRLTNAHRTIFQQALANGDDIRFANSAGTHLPYQIERWSRVSGDTSAAIWVKADTVLPSNSTTLKMYWGNGLAHSRSNGAQIFTNGYVGVWHLGDTTGINPRPNAVSGAPTAKPSNNAGSFGGGAGTYVIPNGIIGKADSLRGGGTTGTRGTPTATCDYLNIGSADDNATTPYTGNNAYTGYSNFTTGYTFSVWLKPAVASIASYQYVSEFANTTNDNNNIQIFRPTNVATMRYQVDNGTTAGTTITTSTNYFVAETWAHYVVTVTGANAMTFYRNGVAGTTGTSTTINNILRTNAWLGKSNYSTDGYIQAVYDQPEISNVARSADWVKLSYKNQKTGSSPVFNLTYPMTSATYNQNSQIAVDSPSITGTSSRFAISPTLPAGLTFSTTTGKISGTPTASSAATNYTVTAYGDSSWSTTAVLNIAVTGAPVVSYQRATVSGTRGVAITPDTIVSAGGPVNSYAVTTGTLPAGLSLDTLTGVISGTPTVVASSFQYVVTGTGPAGSDTARVTIAIADT